MVFFLQIMKLQRFFWNFFSDGGLDPCTPNPSPSKFSFALPHKSASCATVCRHIKIRIDKFTNVLNGYGLLRIKRSIYLLLLISKGSIVLNPECLRRQFLQKQVSEIQLLNSRNPSPTQIKQLETKHRWFYQG